MVRHVNYTLTRGLPFERLLIVKLRRNRRVLHPSSARVALRTSTGSVVPIDVSITSEWGVRMYMSAEETADLPPGECQWDAIAILDGENYQPIARGTITVEELDTVTPTEDYTTMRISYKQRTDLRRTFAWYADDVDTATAVPVVAQDAYLVAIDTQTNAVALKLRWFDTVPNAAAIAALPANERGYLVPATGATVEMHISDTAELAPGEYRFSLMVLVSGDWSELVSGSIVVEFNPASVVEQAAAPMVLAYRQRTDYRRRFSWYASDDTDQTTPLTVTNAYLVAGSDGSAPVAHIRWFASPPDEAAIRALPANERGYLAPVSGATMELHLSDALTIPPGQYSFSIMANQAGDWAEFASGTLVVEFNPASLVAVPT